MILQELPVYHGVSQKDGRIILSLIAQYPNQDPVFYANRLSFTIGQLSVNHYLAIGVAIGYILGAGNTENKFFNSIQPCQRQN